MAIIAIDFDGTCVVNAFPKIGRDIGAQEVLKKLTDEGHRIILFTIRSDDKLKDAVDWFINNNIPLYGINKNPHQQNWSTSPKVHADLFIDDRALGAPLLYVKDGKTKPYIDWIMVENYLIKHNYIKGVITHG